MTDTTAPHASRVSAAASILKFGRESIELDDLAERLGALEAARDRKVVENRSDSGGKGKR
jgi:hypothetical protein